MPQHWRIHTNLEEFKPMNRNKQVQKCLSEDKIFIGSPRTLKTFTGSIKKNDIIVTRDDEKYYIGKITGPSRKIQIKGNNIHYRNVQWLNKQGKNTNGSPLFSPGYRQTCTRVIKKAFTALKKQIR